MNIGAFAVVTGVALQREDRLQVSDYAGLGRRHPVVGVTMTVFLLSLAGFPGTGGFMAKAYLLLGAAEAELWSLSVILVLATVVSYVYYLRLARMMWMEEAPRAGEMESALFPSTARAVLVIAAVFVLVTGVFPSMGIGFARDGIGALLSGLGAAVGIPVP
jgi:NADH-quinone oxidoreductase subunit N